MALKRPKEALVRQATAFLLHQDPGSRIRFLLLRRLERARQIQTPIAYLDRADPRVEAAFKDWAEDKPEYGFVTLERAYAMARERNRARYPDMDLASGESHAA